MNEAVPGNSSNQAHNELAFLSCLPQTDKVGGVFQPVLGSECLLDEPVVMRSIQEWYEVN
jgi:hypothetical protein